LAIYFHILNNIIIHFLVLISFVAHFSTLQVALYSINWSQESN